jgi:hypothetical protein
MMSRTELVLLASIFCWFAAYGAVTFVVRLAGSALIAARIFGVS